MKNYIAKFINNHEDDIDNNDFLKVYTSAASAFQFVSDVGELTKIFNSVGINPLEHMKIVPMYYFGGSDKESIEITSPTIRALFDRSFANCKKLRNLSILRSVKLISTDAFTNCPNLQFIQYEGSLDEFFEINIDRIALWKAHPKLEVLCLATGEVFKK